MARQWTFRRKIAVGFAVSVAMTVVMGLVAIVALRNVVASKDAVIQDDFVLLVQAERLRGWSERKSSAMRAFVLSREERFLEQIAEARREIAASLEQLKLHATEEDSRAIEGIERAEAAHQKELERIIALRRTDASLESVAAAFELGVMPRRQELDTVVDGLLARVGRSLEDARISSTDTASSAITLLIAMGIAVALFSIGMSIMLSRSLGRQIGTAVGQVQSSSAELQSTANQQATGSREQATAMTEITTTISQLLATSRQIAESAVRVAQIAEQTATAARSGEGTVDRAHQSIAGIRRHVDLVVNHMLELGKKSQQIGSVLDIVSELAEQTNILAINATIEAAGAGEAGKRFAVVADEIRKLADRVAGSAKEIRGLIDEVRSAVNTTVMATETVSKAVDGGSRQFVEVAGSLKEIGGMVVTTTQAAREIELSTKQQTSAVEQVNVAITNVAQATRENETSSSQTLQTASQLAVLSNDLLRLVEPQAVARA
jgi:methyl-accepting chemotaxis protein